VSRGGEDPYAYSLARDCARDAVVRKFVEPALELIMLDKALRGEFDREEAWLLFGEMYATAVAGDGSVRRRSVLLTVGGELGGGAALLRLATLHLLNQLLPNELRFNARIYVGEGRYYRIAAYGEDAAGLMRLLAVSAPSAGGGYLSPKFEEFVKEARVEVRVDNIRQTDKDRVAADLIISVGGDAVKYNVYLHKNAVELHFASTDRSRVELAARLLKLAGVSAEVKRKSDEDVWYVYVSTDKLAAGREELRKALAKVVEAARSNDGVDEKKAKRWLEKLERGRVLMEGWPKYYVGLSSSGALVVRFRSTNPSNIEREAQRLEKMGLKRGVYEKAKEIIEEGKARGSLELNFEKWVEVNGKTYVVKVTGGEAVEEDRGGRKLLRIKITAEVGYVKDGQIVDRVEREYTITYSRRGKDNLAVGFAEARADAPGGKEADAERCSALIKALTGREPNVYRRSNGKIEIVCVREHLNNFMRYAELVDVIEEWLEETGQRA
jgi:hypothetical protein